jgi:hypothetical protein
MTYNEVCDSLGAAGLACSRSHVNGLVRAGKIKPTALNYHFVTFNPEKIRVFIVRELKRKGTK